MEFSVQGSHSRRRKWAQESALPLQLHLRLRGLPSLMEQGGQGKGTWPRDLAHFSALSAAHRDGPLVPGAEASSRSLAIKASYTDPSASFMVVRVLNPEAGQAA